jgi:hypothetical protein
VSSLPETSIIGDASTVKLFSPSMAVDDRLLSMLFINIHGGFYKKEIRAKLRKCSAWEWILYVNNGHNEMTSIETLIDIFDVVQ